MTATVVEYALLGWPLPFSLSPAILNAAFAAAGIKAIYTLRPTPSAELAAAVEALRRGDLAGANVTVPHKATVCRQVDLESDLVTAIGAANTLVCTPSGVLAENTDVTGFQRLLETVDGRNGRGRRAVVLGAGGAARAVAYALLSCDYEVKILSRSTAQAGVVAAQLYRVQPEGRLSTGWLTPALLVPEAEQADLLVNATPVGSASDPEGSLWPADRPFPPHPTVVDLVAWPPDTPLVRQAQAAGAWAVGGLEMLVGQAAAAFELWMGQPAPLEAMQRAARDAIQGEAA
jgi:shikimate dehydrogenase